jgi:hypothetical protein
MGREQIIFEQGRDPWDLRICSGGAFPAPTPSQRGRVSPPPAPPQVQSVGARPRHRAPYARAVLDADPDHAFGILAPPPPVRSPSSPQKLECIARGTPSASLRPTRTMAYVDFHQRPAQGARSRDYLARVNEFPKAEAARLAREFGKDYWDGDRRVGYGGMRYDGRWRAVADAMAKHYALKPGRAHPRRRLRQGLPPPRPDPGRPRRGGPSASTSPAYAVENSEGRGAPVPPGGSRQFRLPFPDRSPSTWSFSINTLHNLQCHDLDRALREMQRVGRKHRYLVRRVVPQRGGEGQPPLLAAHLRRRSTRPEAWELVVPNSPATPATTRSSTSSNPPA